MTTAPYPSPWWWPDSKGEVVEKLVCGLQAPNVLSKRWGFVGDHD